MERRSILIVAPHPDDETLGCGGTLAKRAQEGCRITVVVVTDGSNLFRLSRWKIEKDPTPAETSAMRKAETRRALAILGVAETGEKTRTAPQKTRTLPQKTGTVPRPDARRGLAGDCTRLPVAEGAIRFLDVEDASLAGHVESVSETLAAIIREVTPDEVYVTSEHEDHPDHVAACAAVRSAMRKTRTRARLFRYTISLRQGLSRPSIREPSATMDITDQLETKRRAVSQFASHLKIVAKGQTEPFFRNVDAWLQSVEVFFVDP